MAEKIEIFIVFTAPFVLLIFYSLWSLKINRKTYEQRKQLIEMVDIEDFDILDKVTYDQHFRTLRMFQTPVNIYPEDFRIKYNLNNLWR